MTITRILLLVIIMIAQLERQQSIDVDVVAVLLLYMVAAPARRCPLRAVMMVEVIGCLDVQIYN